MRSSNKGKSGKDDKAMMIGVAMVQAMVSFTMHINSSKEFRQKLVDKLEVVINNPKITDAEDIKNRLLSLNFNPEVAEEFSVQISEIKKDDNLDLPKKADILNKLKVNNLTLKESYPKLSEENEKLAEYNKDAEKLSKIINDFFDKLPEDVEKAWKLINYCSMRLYTECKSIEDTISYKPTSSNVQKCALFNDLFKNYIENQLSESTDEKQFKFWFEIYKKARRDKNVAMMLNIDAALQRPKILDAIKESDPLKYIKNSAILDKLKKYNLSTFIQQIREKYDGIFRDDFNSVVAFETVLPNAGMFGSTLELKGAAVLEVDKLNLKNFQEAKSIIDFYKNKNISVLNEEVLKTLVFTLKKNPLGSIDKEFVETHLKDIRIRLSAYNFDAESAIKELVSILKAFRAANLDRKENIENDNIGEILEKQIKNTKLKIETTERKIAELTEFHKSTLKKSVKAVNEIFKESPELKAIDEIGRLSDNDARVHAILTLGRTHNFPDEIDYYLVDATNKKNIKSIPVRPIPQNRSPDQIPSVQDIKLTKSKSKNITNKESSKELNPMQKGLSNVDQKKILWENIISFHNVLIKSDFKTFPLTDSEFDNFKAKYLKLSSDFDNLKLTYESTEKQSIQHALSSIKELLSKEEKTITSTKVSKLTNDSEDDDLVKFDDETDLARLFKNTSQEREGFDKEFEDEIREVLKSDEAAFKKEVEDTEKYIENFKKDQISLQISSIEQKAKALDAMMNAHRSAIIENNSINNPLIYKKSPRFTNEEILERQKSLKNKRTEIKNTLIELAEELKPFDLGYKIDVNILLNNINTKLKETELTYNGAMEELQKYYAASQNAKLRRDTQKIIQSRTSKKYNLITTDSEQKSIKSKKSLPKLSLSSKKSQSLTASDKVKRRNAQTGLAKIQAMKPLPDTILGKPTAELRQEISSKIGNYEVTCDVYLMSTLFSDEKPKITDKTHLYLYKEGNEYVYYIKNKNNEIDKITLKGLPEDKINTLEKQYLIGKSLFEAEELCTNKDICRSLLKITAKNGHTQSKSSIIYKVNVLGDQENHDKLFSGLKKETDVTTARKAFLEYLLHVLSDPTKINSKKIDLENPGESATFMKDLLLLKGDGDVDGLRLYKEAIEEERNSYAFREAVFLSSLQHREGAKWNERLMLWVGGPSASGKSFSAKAVLDEVDDKIMLGSDNNDGNYIVSIDGGIEREVSQVRQLLLQASLCLGYPGIKDLHSHTDLDMKGHVHDAVIYNHNLNLVTPDTFADPRHLASQFKQYKNTKQIFSEIVEAGDIEDFQETVARNGNLRAWMLDPKQIFEINNLQIGCESKEYRAKFFADGKRGSAWAKYFYTLMNKDPIYIAIKNDFIFVSQNEFGQWIKLKRKDDKSKALNLSQRDLEQFTTTGFCNQYCEIFLMEGDANNNPLISDKLHLHLYKDNNNLIYHVRGEGGSIIRKEISLAKIHGELTNDMFNQKPKEPIAFNNVNIIRSILSNTGDDTLKENDLKGLMEYRKSKGLFQPAIIELPGIKQEIDKIISTDNQEINNLTHDLTTLLNKIVDSSDELTELTREYNKLEQNYKKIAITKDPNDPELFTPYALLMAINESLMAYNDEEESELTLKSDDTYEPSITEYKSPGQIIIESSSIDNIKNEDTVDIERIMNDYEEEKKRQIELMEKDEFTDSIGMEEETIEKTPKPTQWVIAKTDRLDWLFRNQISSTKIGKSVTTPIPISTERGNLQYPNNKIFNEKDKSHAFVFFRNVNAADLTPLSQTAHESEATLAPGKFTFNRIQDISGIPAFEAKPVKDTFKLSNQEYKKDLNNLLNIFLDDKNYLDKDTIKVSINNDNHIIVECKKDKFNVSQILKNCNLNELNLSKKQKEKFISLMLINNPISKKAIYKPSLVGFIPKKPIANSWNNKFEENIKAYKKNRGIPENVKISAEQTDLAGRVAENMYTGISYAVINMLIKGEDYRLWKQENPTNKVEINKNIDEIRKDPKEIIIALLAAAFAVPAIAKSSQPCETLMRLEYLPGSVINEMSKGEAITYGITSSAYGTSSFINKYDITQAQLKDKKKGLVEKLEVVINQLDNKLPKPLLDTEFDEEIIQLKSYMDILSGLKNDINSTNSITEFELYETIAFNTLNAIPSLKQEIKDENIKDIQDEFMPNVNKLAELQRNERKRLAASYNKSDISNKPTSSYKSENLNSTTNNPPSTDNVIINKKDKSLKIGKKPLIVTKHEDSTTFVLENIKDQPSHTLSTEQVLENLLLTITTLNSTLDKLNKSISDVDNSLLKLTELQGRMENKEILSEKPTSIHRFKTSS